MENKEGYSWRNAFVPVPTVTSFEEFNEHLWKWCEQDAQRLHYKYKVPIQELWEVDRESLLKLPEYPFPVFRYEVLSVNKYGFVVIDTNKYGRAPTLAGKMVQAKIFFDHVEFFHDYQPVGRYRRSYDRNEEQYDWSQYIGTLLKKPGAVEYTRFFKQLPQQWQELLAQSRGRERKGALQLLERDRAGRQRPSVRGRPVHGGGKWKDRPGQHPPVLLHNHKKRVPAKTIRTEGLHTKIAV